MFGGHWQGPPKQKVRQDMTTEATKSVFTSVIIALFVYIYVLLRSLNTCNGMGKYGPSVLGNWKAFLNFTRLKPTSSVVYRWILSSIENFGYIQ